MAGFPLKCSCLLYQLLFTLPCMLSVFLAVVSVAPEDFDTECATFAENGSFNNSNQKVLLDTQFYQSTTLMSHAGDNKLWISLDIDMTTGVYFSKVHVEESIKFSESKTIKDSFVSKCQ